MFTEILKIIPKLDQNELNKMERTLSQRFTRVAKTFGKGIAGVFKGGAVAGLAANLVNKLLNPLKETQEAIERTLKSGDDIVTFANSFGTSAGNLTKLIAAGRATGLDQDNLFLLINKFQSAVAGAAADPSKPSAVTNFVNDKDTAESFFSFIQSLNKLQKVDPQAAQRAQVEVFGDKQILKIADFLQADFQTLFRDLGLDNISTQQLTKDQNLISALNDRTDLLEARRQVRDVRTKAGLLNNGIVNDIEKGKQRALDLENQRIANFKNIQAVAETADKINVILEQGVQKIGEFITKVTPKINDAVDALGKISTSSVWRSIFGGKKGKSK